MKMKGKSVDTIRINMINHFYIILLCLICIRAHAQKNDIKWTKPNLKGHWKLIDTKIVDEVPFLNLQAPEPDPMKMVYEDSPWDSYTKHDLVFENDSMYMVDYPIQAFTPAHYLLDSGYLHVGTKDEVYTYPTELVHDTLLFYRPLRSEPGYFKETYVRTIFNDSVFNILKKYGINYPELAGTWILVREEDYDYGTHYELRFPHSIPDAIKFTREKMIDALEHEKIFMMNTDGVKRDYSFWYQKSYIYFKPGKWYKGSDDPWIHFYKKQGE